MFTQRLSLTNQDARKVSSTQLHTLGSIAETADGRVFRYSKAGAANLVAGNLQVNADLDSNVVNKAVTAASAIGSFSVSFTAGASQTLDAYKDGLLVVNDATGEGIAYAVNGNTAGTAVTVSLKSPIVVALVSSTSEVTLKKNTWDSTVLSATDQADQAVGVPNTAVTAAYYYWAQTRGEAAVLADEAVNRGLALTIGTGTAGAVEALDAAGEPQIGVASEALVDTENRAAFLTMD
jgi:hypothetical protein